MLKKCFAGLMLLLAFVSSAYAEPYLWVGYDSAARLAGGHSDFSDAKPSGVRLDFHYDDVTVTEEFLNLSGTLTLSGGTYSFREGGEVRNVSGTSRTFALSPFENYKVGDTGIAYSLGIDEGLILETGDGLEGVTASWDFPDMPSLNGQVTLPKFRTTQEQINSFVPCIECTYSDSKVTGFKWRIVNPSDPSKPVPQNFDMGLNFAVYKRNFGGGNLYTGKGNSGSEGISINAGSTPEGTITFDSPLEESGLEIQVFFWGATEGVSSYVWTFSAPWLWVGHNSTARLAGGHSDFSDANFSGVVFDFHDDNVTVTEENRSLSGTLTLSGGTYSFQDGGETRKVSGTPMIFTLRPFDDLEIGNRGIGYSSVTDAGNGVELMLEAGDSLEGVTASWDFPDMPSLNGHVTLPKFTTTEEQIDSFVPYIECIYSGSKVTGFKWRIVSLLDTSEPVPQDWDTGINFDVSRRGSNGSNSYGFNVAAGDTPEGTVTFDNPIEEPGLEVWVHLNGMTDGVSDYAWDFYTPYLWVGYQSNAHITGGHSDFSDAKFSHVNLDFHDDNVTVTEENRSLSGTLTLSGGNYSFQDGGETRKVSGTPMTFTLRPWDGLEVGNRGIGYWLGIDGGLILETGDGLEGVIASWDFPAMPSLNGQVTLPKFKTTEEQLDSFVPYIEYVYTDSKVTGFKWRLVNPSDASTPVPQDFGMGVNFWAGGGIDSGFYFHVNAGDTPEGTVSFDKPAGEWLDISVNIDGVTEGVNSYTWYFAPSPAPYLWACHASLAGLNNGTPDYSNARFLRTWLEVTQDDTTATEEYVNLSGDLTLSGGTYSFWDGKEMQKVSGTSETFTLKSDMEVGDNYLDYWPSNGAGGSVGFTLEAEEGLAGIKASWTFPDMPALNGEGTVPHFRTTKAQCDSFVPYIEFKRSDSKVTGLTWRVVNPSNTSTPLPQDFRMRFRIRNVYGAGSGFNTLYTGSWQDIPAGETPEGEITFDEPIEESGIWGTRVRLQAYENEDGPANNYDWYFLRLDEPALDLWTNHISRVLVIDGEPDYGTAEFRGLDLYPCRHDGIVAEAEYFTAEGTLTLPAGEYQIFEDYNFQKQEYTWEKLEEIDSETDVTFQLKMGPDVSFAGGYIEYTPFNDEGNTLLIAGDTEEKLNGQTVSWSFPDNPKMSGQATIPNYKSTNEQIDGGMPYIEFITSTSGNEITGFKWRLATHAKPKEAVVPAYRTDFRFICRLSESRTQRTEWVENYDGSTGTVTFDTPVTQDTLDRLKEKVFVTAVIRTYEDPSNPCYYQWAFIPSEEEEDLTITTEGLSGGTVGTEYNETLAVYPPDVKVTWSLVEGGGSLPDGLTLDADTGEIHGTPTKAGTFSFTVRARASNGRTGTKDLRIVIKAAAPVITTTSLAGGYVGVNYSEEVKAAGEGVTLSLFSGTLPDGLKFNAGTISGTPTKAGTFDFTVRATNAGGSADKPLSIKIISGTAPAIKTVSLPTGTAGKTYSATLSASGTKTITWSKSGQWPSGLTLSSAGKISGKPKAGGTYSFTAKAKNNFGQDTKTFSLVINDVKPVIKTSSLKDATVGKSYSATVSATGTGLTWSVAGGTLPSGVTLNKSTGKLSGKAKTAGTYRVTLKAANTAGSATKAYTLKVVETKPTIKTSTLKAATVGVSYSATILGTGTGIKWTWSGSRPSGLQLDGATGRVSGTPKTAGTFKFTVKATNTGGTASKTVKLVVNDQKPVITTDSLKDGQLKTAYSETLKATTANLKWTKSAGKLPTGLKLSTAGKITGTPTKAGTFNFTVKATSKKSSKIYATKKFSIRIVRQTKAGTSDAMDYEAEELLNENEQDDGTETPDTFEGQQDAVTPDGETDAGIIFDENLDRAELMVLSGDEALDGDMLEVAPERPVTFAIGPWTDADGNDVEVTNLKVYVDDEPYAVEVDTEGFTLPESLFVEGREFSVYVTAEAGGQLLKSKELYLIVWDGAANVPSAAQTNESRNDSRSGCDAVGLGTLSLILSAAFFLRRKQK